MDYNEIVEIRLRLKKWFSGCFADKIKIADKEKDAFGALGKLLREYMDLVPSKEVDVEKGMITDQQKETLDKIVNRLQWNEKQATTMLEMFTRRQAVSMLNYKEAAVYLNILGSVEYVKRWGGKTEPMSAGQDKKITVMASILSFDAKALLILLRMLTGEKHDRISEYNMSAGAKLINLLESVKTQYWTIGWLI
jgi:hypothetical protein